MAAALAANPPAIYTEADARMKAFSRYHSQYALHDNVHMLRVTERMARIMPGVVKDALNPIELALLILAALFHDQGMVPDEDDFRALANDPVFELFAGNWAIDHPNLKDSRARLADPSTGLAERERCLAVENELGGAMLSDFLRLGHADRSGGLVHSAYGQARRG